MQELPGPCVKCGVVCFSKYAFSMHMRDMIGSACLTPEQMQALGMVAKRGVWFSNRYEADHGVPRRQLIPLPGDTVDFWHYRLEHNPLWREEEWDGTDEHLAQKTFLSWHIVHATVIEVAYCGGMVTLEADHPTFGRGWRTYTPWEGLDVVHPGETPLRRSQVYEAWMCLKRLGVQLSESDLVFAI